MVFLSLFTSLSLSLPFPYPTLPTFKPIPLIDFSPRTFYLLNVRCFYHPDYVFPLPPEHPFPMDKFWRAEAMIRAESAGRITILPASPAPLNLLLNVHLDPYLHAIETASLDHPASVRLGLPTGPALLLRSRLETGGTLAALDAALCEGLACNLAGGTHHAFPDRGLGYCVLNDVAIAIRALHLHAPDARVLVIDTDAHQGNGTHAIFAQDPRVFTYSIHVGKNYPSVKTPGDLDVPLPRYVSGAEFLHQLRLTLPPLFPRFHPDVVFWIAGADLHQNDRFGQMRLTDSDFAQRDTVILDLIHQHRTPTVILYGGGYNRDRLHTARLHAHTVLRAAGLTPLPSPAPEVPASVIV